MNAVTAIIHIDSCDSVPQRRLSNGNQETGVMRYRLNHLSSEECNVLIYVLSHGGNDQGPTKENVLWAGLPDDIVDQFLKRDILREVNGKFQVVLESFLYPDLPEYTPTDDRVEITTSGMDTMVTVDTMGFSTMGFSLFSFSHYDRLP
jgi:hypothetical protein